MINVISATSPEQLGDFRALVREFSAWAVATFHADDAQPPSVFARLESELASLPGKYSEPNGGLFLAVNDGQAVGCIACFPNDDQNIEVTRLWVKPEQRGLQIGNVLVQHFLAYAQNAGYKRAVLRSHKGLKSAHKIYQNAGFHDMAGHSYFPSFDEIEIAMDYNLN